MTSRHRRRSALHDAVVRDFAAAIQLGEDAVEPDLLLHFAQPRRETVGPRR